MAGWSDPTELWVAEGCPKWGRSSPIQGFGRVQSKPPVCAHPSQRTRVTLAIEVNATVNGSVNRALRSPFTFRPTGIPGHLLPLLIYSAFGEIFVSQEHEK